jgi:hypothetical protein
MAWDTGCSTLASSECRSVDGECSSSPTRLVDVLEPSAPPGSFCRLALRPASSTGVEAGREAPVEARERPGEPEYLRQAISAKWSKRSSGPAGDKRHNLTVVQVDDVGASPQAPKAGADSAATDPTPSSSVRRLTPVGASA